MASGLPPHRAVCSWGVERPGALGDARRHGPVPVSLVSVRHVTRLDHCSQFHAINTCFLSTIIVSQRTRNRKSPTLQGPEAPKSPFPGDLAHAVCLPVGTASSRVSPRPAPRGPRPKVPRVSAGPVPAGSGRKGRRVTGPRMAADSREVGQLGPPETLPPSETSWAGSRAPVGSREAPPRPGGVAAGPFLLSRTTR